MQSKNPKQNRDNFQKLNFDLPVQQQAKHKSTSRLPGVGQLNYDPFALPLPEGFQTEKPLQTDPNYDPFALPLSEGFQMKAEDVLQTDLSGVKMKESKQAADLGALAYTQGNEITFAPGKFDPDTQKGQELIGHELAHVKQQQEGKVQATTQAKGIPLNDDPKLEQEADQLGKQIAQAKTNSSSNLQKKPKTFCENQPMQMKRHSLAGKAEFWSSIFDQTDDSYFEAQSNLTVQPYDGTADFTPGKLQNIDEAAPIKMIPHEKMGDEGKIILTSKLSSLIDQAGVYYKTGKPQDFSATFSYKRTPNGIIYVYIDESSKVIEEKHALETKAQTENEPGTNYHYLKTIQSDSSDEIVYSLGFLQNTVFNSFKKDSKTTKDSHKDYDFGIGTDLGFDIDVKIHLVMDGNDVVMILGSGLIFKGALGALFKKFKSLILSNEDIKKLLSKQKIDIDINPQIAAELKGHFNYAYKRDTHTKISSDIVTAYTTGGELAKEINRFKIQQPKNISSQNIFFETENQHLLSTSEKSALDEFLKQDSTKMMLKKVQTGQYLIQLEGHASSSSSEEYNKDIANKRIDAIRTYIQLNPRIYGLDNRHFIKSNMGRTQADTTLISAGDRRVLISFIKK